MITIPPRAISIIQGYEGLSGWQKDNKYHPYHCAADRPEVMTIGRGHVIQPDENYSRGLTLVEVNKLFCKDVQPRAEKLNSYFINAKYYPQEWEFAGALSTFYNIEEPWTPGHPVFDLFVRGKKIEAMNHLMLYEMANHQKQLGLQRRRATEALCILTSRVIIAKNQVTQNQLYSALEATNVKIQPLS